MRSEPQLGLPLARRRMPEHNETPSTAPHSYPLGSFASLVKKGGIRVIVSSVHLWVGGGCRASGDARHPPVDYRSVRRSIEYSPTLKYTSTSCTSVRVVTSQPKVSIGTVTVVEVFSGTHVHGD